MLYPDRTKGMANPREYELKSKTPWLTVSSIAAKVKIDPKIGPIHGVQPNAKVTPIITGKAQSLENSAAFDNLFSIFRKLNLKLKKPSICNEKKITKKPEINLNSFEPFKNDWPINDADAPRLIKITENPNENKIVLNKIFR